MKTFAQIARLPLLVSVPWLVLALTACSASADWRKPLNQAKSDITARQYPQAEAKLLAALSQAEQAPAQDNLAIQQALGEVLLQQNKVPEAESRLQSALDFAQRKFGNQSIESMPALSRLSEVYYRTHRFDKAESAAREALSIGEGHWGKDDVRLEPYISDVVGTACINGTCKDETELYLRLLALRERTCGKDDQRTCAARQMLAESLMHKKNYDRASDLYKYNLSVYSKQNPLFVPGTLNHIAAVYEVEGKHEQAAATWKQAVDLERRSPLLQGALTISLQSLARHFEDLGQLAQAEQYYKEALDVVVAQAGAKNPSAADYLLNYARVLKKQGKAEQAKQYQQQAEKLEDVADAIKRKALAEHAKG